MISDIITLVFKLEIETLNVGIENQDDNVKLVQLGAKCLSSVCLVKNVIFKVMNNSCHLMGSDFFYCHGFSKMDSMSSAQRSVNGLALQSQGPGLYDLQSTMRCARVSSLSGHCKESIGK